MRLATNVVFVACFFLLGKTEPRVITDQDPSEVDDALKKLGKEVLTLRQTVGALSRQVMLQQMFVEEKMRSDADSGVKQVCVCVCVCVCILYCR